MRVAVAGTFEQHVCETKNRVVESVVEGKSQQQQPYQQHVLFIIEDTAGVVFARARCCGRSVEVGACVGEVGGGHV